MYYSVLKCIEVYCVVSFCIMKCSLYILTPLILQNISSPCLITISYHSPTELRKIGKGVVLGAISLVGHSADGFIGQ